MTTMQQLMDICAPLNVDPRLRWLDAGTKCIVLYCWYMANESDAWFADHAHETEEAAIEAAYKMVNTGGLRYMNLLKDTNLFKYLTGDMFEKTAVLTIRRVTLESMTAGQKSEDKPVVYFKETKKGMVLNKTNANRLYELFGTWDTDQMIGKRVTLTNERGEAFGKPYNAVRISLQQPPTPRNRAEEAQADAVDLVLPTGAHTE